MTWKRVSRQRPCEICLKNDWCSYDGDTSYCMRVPSDHEVAAGGWIHKAAPDAPRCHLPRPNDAALVKTRPLAADLVWGILRKLTTPDELTAWADKLALPVDCIDYLGAVVQGDTLLFPMHDGGGNVIGLRTRYPDGRKMAVRGSRAGLFLPTIWMGGECVICEGPTDAAAAMALGFEPIGRPSCLGCEQHVNETIKRLEIPRVTVCADADGPGMTGARKLCSALRVPHRLVTAGGHKDLRDWLAAKVDRATVDAIWGESKWTG